jgi:hypothetical protein
MLIGAHRVRRSDTIEPVDGHAVLIRQNGQEIVQRWNDDADWPEAPGSSATLPWALPHD